MSGTISLSSGLLLTVNLFSDDEDEEVAVLREMFSSHSAKIDSFDAKVSVTGELDER